MNLNMKSNILSLNSCRKIALIWISPCRLLVFVKKRFGSEMFPKAVLSWINPISPSFFTKSIFWSEYCGNETYSKTVIVKGPLWQCTETNSGKTYREFLPNANFITANFVTAVFQNFLNIFCYCDFISILLMRFFG